MKPLAKVRGSSQGAINLDSRFQKDKERGSEFELPQLEGMKK
jgi:hypothetical protein